MNPDPPNLRHPRPHGVHDLQSCNSTATLFLGSARKSWMNAANPSSSESLPSPTVAAPPASQPTATFASSDSTLMSPVSPGENLPHPDPKPSLPATSLSVAPRTTDSVPSPSLPSPASSHNNSPANALDGNPQALPRPVPSIFPPAGPAHAPSSALEAMSAAQSTADPSTSNNALAELPTPNQPPLNDTSAPSASSADRPELTFTDQFWSALRTRLDTFENTPEVKRSFSASDHCRSCLLRDACIDEDLLYLVFHQVYCVYTTDMRKLTALPEFSLANEQAFIFVQELLMPNRALSPVFLKFAAGFPLELSQAMKCTEYRDALLQVVRCLSCFSERWVQFDRDVRERGYPPLIDEMVHLFDLTSTVLLTVIFLSMCRRIYGLQYERELRAVFLQDKQNYERRFAAGRYPACREQIVWENSKIIESYLAIRARPYQSSSGGSPVVPRNNPWLSQRAPLSRPTANGYAPGPVPSQASPTGSTLPPHHQVPGVPVGQPTRSPAATVPGPRVTAMASAPGQSLGASQTSRSATRNQTTSPMITANQQTSRPTTQNQVASPVTTTNQQPTMATMATAMSTRPGQSLGFSQNQIPSPVTTVNQQPAMTMPSLPGQSPGFPRAPQVNAQDNHVRVAAPSPARQGVQQVPGSYRPGPQQLQQKQPSRYPMFLPPPGYIPPYTVHPNPLRVALHQANLREPVKKLIRRGPQGMEEGELFQYLSSFAVPPQLLGRSECSFNWKFSLSDDDYQRFPRHVPNEVGQRALRVYFQGGHLFHLRCIKLAQHAKAIDQHSWSVAECAWPSVIYIFVNGMEHFVWRKVHHGKDLPLDITDALREGENNVTFHFLRNASECKDISYALAIEMMDIATLNQVKQLVRTIPAAATSARIQQQLSSSRADDELSIVNDDINVNLVDPFSAQIFNIPVRGVVCRHLECFDLNNFLSTKASKSGKAPMESDWRCPICREDARPQSLVIDSYLFNVRNVLADGNRLHGAKGIRIKSSGSWELRAEADTPTEGPTRSGVVPAKRKPDGSARTPEQRPAQRPKTSHPPEPAGDSQSVDVIELD